MKPNQKVLFSILGVVGVIALALAIVNIFRPPPVPQIRVVVDGLLSPIGIAALPDGSLLVAEDGTGAEDDSSGISLVRPDGTVGRLVSGFPSNRDSGDLAGAPLVGVFQGPG